MAHVEKRGPNRWRARYRGPDGREVSRTFAKKSDAERFLTSVEHSKFSGAYVDPAAGKTTFKEYAEAWRLVQVHRPGTTVSIEHQLRNHVYPVIGDRALSSLRPSDLQALVQRIGQDLAPSTVRVIYGRVVAILRAAVRDRVIATTPSIDVKLPAKKAAATLEVLTTEQVLALAAAVHPRYRALVIRGAGLGLRRGELLGLTVDRVDFLRRAVRVDRQLVDQPGGGADFGPLKTSGSYRSVPLPDSVGLALAAHLEEWPAHPELGLVFTNELGGPVLRAAFTRGFERAVKRAGLQEWVSPHDLRHYYSSLLIQSGASVKAVQARLGHTSAMTTLDIYGHLFPDEEDRTRATVDKAFAAPAASPRPDVAL
jgi:integrase